MDFDLYWSRTGLLRKEFADSLDATPSQLDHWRRNGQVPFAVWKRCVTLWGDKKVKPTGVVRPHHRFRLPPSYAAETGITTPPATVEQAPVTAIPEAPRAAPADAPQDAPPETPPAPPKTVPWEVHEAMMLTLMHQNSAILADKAVVEADNQRLYKVIALFKTEIGFEVTVNAIGVSGPPPTPLPEIAPEHRASIREQLRDLARFNGNGAVLTDLERRLPKVDDEPGFDFTPAAAKDFDRLAEVNKVQALTAMTRFISQPPDQRRAVPLAQGGRLKEVGAEFELKAGDLRILLHLDGSRWRIVGFGFRGDKRFFPKER